MLTLTQIDLEVYSFLLQNAKRANQFSIIVNRVEPPHDIIKAFSISRMIQNVSFIADGYTYEEVKLGSAYMNVVQELQGGEIALTFTEGNFSEVFNFLTRKENGKSILPKDGTYLLPYEYYFKIDIIHHFNPADNLLLGALGGIGGIKPLASGLYKLDGSIEVGYDVEDEKLQMIQAKFKPMMSF